MALPLTGRCLCGAVRFECQRTPISAVACHCLDCQKAHSAPFAACALMPPGSVNLLAGEPKRYETLAESGARVFREFCGHCGTHLFSGSAAYPDFKSVKIVALDNPASISPVAHTWTVRMIEWPSIDDELPRFPKNAETTDLERLWREKRCLLTLAAWFGSGMLVATLLSIPIFHAELVSGVINEASRR